MLPRSTSGTTPFSHLVAFAGEATRLTLSFTPACDMPISSTRASPITTSRATSGEIAISQDPRGLLRPDPGAIPGE